MLGVTTLSSSLASGELRKGHGVRGLGEREEEREREDGREGEREGVGERSISVGIRSSV